MLAWSIDFALWRGASWSCGALLASLCPPDAACSPLRTPFRGRPATRCALAYFPIHHTYQRYLTQQRVPRAQGCQCRAICYRTPCPCCACHVLTAASMSVQGHPLRSPGLRGRHCWRASSRSNRRHVSADDLRGQPARRCTAVRGKRLLGLQSYTITCSPVRRCCAVPLQYSDCTLCGVCGPSTRPARNLCP